MAECLNVQLLPPRRVEKQQDRDNIPGDAQDFYRISVGVATLDAIIHFFEVRFGADQQKLIKLFVLRPTKMALMPLSQKKEDISSTLDHYQVSQMKILFKMMKRN